MKNGEYLLRDGKRLVTRCFCRPKQAGHCCREERYVCVLTQVPTDVEKCQDRVECFNADLKADWERWQNNKRQDFRQLLTGMADRNIQYYEKVKDRVDEWQNEGK